MPVVYRQIFTCLNFLSRNCHHMIISGIHSKVFFQWRYRHFSFSVNFQMSALFSLMSSRARRLFVIVSPFSVTSIIVEDIMLGALFYKDEQDIPFSDAACNPVGDGKGRRRERKQEGISQIHPALTSRQDVNRDVFKHAM